MSLSTASKAWRLPWMSEMIATFIDAVDPPAARDRTPQSCSRAGRARRWWQSCALAGANRIAFRVVPEDSHRGWLAALAAAVALAEAAVVALRPRHGVIAAAPVEALAHFDAAHIARARRYGRGQLALGGAGAMAEGALLIWLVRRDRRSGPARRSLALVGGRGAGLSLGLVLVPLPFGALMRKRALRAGLATQSWRGWTGDVARSGALGAAFAAAGAVVVAALMRRYGADWWKAAVAGSVAVAVVVTAAGPVLLDPIFNDFTPLPDGELRR